MIAPQYPTVISYLLDTYAPSRVNLKRESFLILQTSARQLDQFAKHPVRINELSDELVISYMRWQLSQGKSPRTVNDRRASILTLWRHAQRKRVVPTILYDIPKCREPRRLVKAWWPDEMQRVIEACRRTRTYRDWGPLHWEAIVRTCLDTAFRITSLLLARREHFNSHLGTLFVPAENTKNDADAVKALRLETIEALMRMTHNERFADPALLFPWPWRTTRAHWHYKLKVLKPAGMPCGSRDLWHKLRRTSYTYVAVKHGIPAATKHAEHRSDLSRNYLDVSMMPQPSALDALPEF